MLIALTILFAVANFLMALIMFWHWHTKRPIDGITAIAAALAFISCGLGLLEKTL